MNRKVLLLILCTLGMMSACGGGSDEPSIPDIPDNPDKPVLKREVKILPRVNDGSFDNGAQLGIYMVSYGATDSGDLKGKGNYIDNACFTLQGKEWKSDQTYYWEDEAKKASIYAYYPYHSIENALQVPVHVTIDQTTQENYRKSDFLAGRIQLNKQGGELIEIQMDHAMAKLAVKVVPGNGFTEDELLKSDVQVIICNVYTSMRMDLSSMNQQIVNDKVSKVHAFKEGPLAFSALVPPQVIKEGTFIEVIVDGASYYLKKAITLAPNKLYNFTVSVKKVQGGLDVGIDGWEDAGEDFGGSVG